MATRKQYTQEGIDSAVKLLIGQGYTIAEAARNLLKSGLLRGRADGERYQLIDTQKKVYPVSLIY